jgi:hypothetical protein
MLFLANTRRVTFVPVAFTQVTTTATSEPLSAEDNGDPSLNLKRDNFAFLRHYDSETSFIWRQKLWTAIAQSV